MLPIDVSPFSHASDEAAVLGEFLADFFGADLWKEAPRCVSCDGSPRRRRDHARFATAKQRGSLSDFSPAETESDARERREKMVGNNWQYSRVLLPSNPQFLPFRIRSVAGSKLPH
jgi:hypothetical protein